MGNQKTKENVEDNSTNLCDRKRRTISL